MTDSHRSGLPQLVQKPNTNGPTLWKISFVFQYLRIFEPIPLGSTIPSPRCGLNEKLFGSTDLVRHTRRRCLARLRRSIALECGAARTRHDPSVIATYKRAFRLPFPRLRSERASIAGGGGAKAPDLCCSARSLRRCSLPVVRLFNLRLSIAHTGGRARRNAARHPRIWKRDRSASRIDRGRVDCSWRLYHRIFLVMRRMV